MVPYLYSEMGNQKKEKQISLSRSFSPVLLDWLQARL
jgi:hypothetical protein